MDKIIAALLVILGGFALVLIVAALSSVVTMFAWDHSIAQVTTLPQLNLTQAFFMNVLGGMLFKSASLSASKK
jgi:hypothetical protein